MPRQRQASSCVAVGPARVFQGHTILVEKDSLSTRRISVSRFWYFQRILRGKYYSIHSMRIDTSIAVLGAAFSSGRVRQDPGPKDTDLTADRPTVRADLSRPRQRMQRRLHKAPRRRCNSHFPSRSRPRHHHRKSTPTATAGTRAPSTTVFPACQLTATAS